MRISSTRNQVVKDIRSLARNSVRRERGRYLAEGVRLVSEAVATKQTAVLVLFEPESLKRSAAGLALLSAIPGWAEMAHEVEPHVLAAAAQTETPSGVIAVLRAPRPEPLESHAADRFGLILDGLSDPGNAGTILRTADAFGVGYIITTPESVDLFSPKVVRAGMGAHFRLPLYEHRSWEDIEQALPGVALVVADASAGRPLQKVGWPERACIVIGREAAGPSQRALELSDLQVRIPLRPEVESLNAAVAAAILLYAGPGSALIGELSVTDDGLRRTR
jgi:TrmH family RNA methyltransferase